MATLIFGLLVFLGAHSLRILAPGWRTQRPDGDGVFKGVYALCRCSVWRSSSGVLG